jgi:tetratricopeptide (TPR) repeat protein
LAGGASPEKSLPWYEKAIATLTAARERNPRMVLIRYSLGKSHAGRAAALARLERHAEAMRDWERAVELDRPDRLPEVRAQRAETLLRLGKFTEAIAQVAELTAQRPDSSPAARWSAERWYGFARIYAVAAGKVPDKKNQEYADRALELLHEAVKAGWKDAARAAKDPDLVSLRGRADFKRMLAELENRP